MYKSFGFYLRKERKKQGLTAEKVSSACGISRSYVTLIENNKRFPSKKNISKIALALNLKTGTVLNWYLEDINQRIRKDIKG